MTAGNVGWGSFGNTTYQTVDALTNVTFDSSKTYLIQIRGTFNLCRKSTTPDEVEGFYLENESKFFEYHPGTPDLYVKAAGPDKYFINIDESD